MEFKSLMSKQNLLRDVRPELFAQLKDKENNKDITCGSSKKIEWQCEHGHTWFATTRNRVVRNDGCPFCSGLYAIPGETDLATTHPEIAKQLVDTSLGTILKANSHRKVAWKCEKGHIWTTSVVTRVAGNGCPFCSGRLAIPGETDLATTHPELAAQLVDQTLAITLKAGSDKKVEWQCEYGHMWITSVSNRVKGRGCPWCAGKYGKVEDNTLAGTYPKLAMQLVDKSLATKLKPQSNKKVEWECEHGHRWFAAVTSRTSKDAGCPFCSGLLAIPGETDLATTHPELSAELVDQSLATKLKSNSHKKVSWKCTRGHIWDATVANRVRGTNCPICAGKQVLVGFNDLYTTHEALCEELVDKKIGYKVTAGSHKEVEWQCSICGNIWTALIKERALRGKGCPYCSGRIAIPNVNSLNVTHPEIAAELVDKSLATVLKSGSGQSVEWECPTCHNRWFATVYNRVGNKSGCPLCWAKSSRSRTEEELCKVVSTLVGDNVEVLFNDRKLIEPQELDIVIPSHKIAIEFNGVYWHSDVKVPDRKYHYNKQKACEEQGYQMITIWEDDWLNRRDVVIKMLATKLHALDNVSKLLPDVCLNKYYARKLVCKEVGSIIARDFLNDNHIQGAVTANYHFALCDGDDVVALLSVRSPKNNARMKRGFGEWEIQRYATKGHVIGGFSKLLKYAEKTLVDNGIDLVSWVSFSANEVSDGNMYEKCGFMLDREIPPDYKYVGSVTDNVRKPKESFQKSKFKKSSKLQFEEGLTELELAELNGLHRCWDTGKKRWVKAVKV